jgi:hypothetical protein
MHVLVQWRLPSNLFFGTSAVARQTLAHWLGWFWSNWARTVEVMGASVKDGMSRRVRRRTFAAFLTRTTMEHTHAYNCIYIYIYIYTYIVLYGYALILPVQRFDSLWCVTDETLTYYVHALCSVFKITHYGYISTTQSLQTRYNR